MNAGVKRLVSAGLWLVGLATLTIGVLIVFLGSGLTDGGFLVTLGIASGFVVSGLVLSGLAAILDALVDVRDRL